MKLKLTFLCADLRAANKACEQMLLANISKRDIHFLAKPGTNLGLLPVATVAEKSNLVLDALRGTFIGASLGLLAGIYVLIFPAWMTETPLWYTTTAWHVVLSITTLIGAIVMALASALIGAHLFNNHLGRYQGRINKGAILMIVRTPFYKVSTIRNLMH